MPSAATTPLGRSRVSVGASINTHITPLFVAFTAYERPLDREWIKNKQLSKGESPMKNQENKKSSTIQGFIANPQIFVNKSRQSITHKMSNDLKIEMPINLYKKILGIPFEILQSNAESGSIQKKSIFGLVARPAIFLSQDKQYLIHQVLGIRVSKHINYYKQILGAEYTPKTKSA